MKREFFCALLICSVMNGSDSDGGSVSFGDDGATDFAAIECRLDALEKSLREEIKEVQDRVFAVMQQRCAALEERVAMLLQSDQQSWQHHHIHIGHITTLLQKQEALQEQVALQERKLAEQAAYLHEQDLRLKALEDASSATTGDSAQATLSFLLGSGIWSDK